MSYFRAGATFRWSNADQPDPHLWLVLTDPDPVTGKVVAVMVVTKKDHTDPTTSLLPGDHPFIDHESHVDFRTAKPVSAERLLADMNAGICVVQQNLSQGVLKRVRVGLLTSERTVNFVKDYCRLLWPMA